MTKMYLPAKPANEGARLLAWWLHCRVSTPGFARSVLHTKANVRETMIDRLVWGEILPGGEMGARIWAATEGKVPLSAWRQRPRGGWFDRPQAFQEQEARGLHSPEKPTRAGGACPPFRASPAPVHQALA